MNKECCNNKIFHVFEDDAVVEEKNEDKMEIKNEKVSIAKLKGMKIKDKESEKKDINEIYVEI